MILLPSSIQKWLQRLSLFVTGLAMPFFVRAQGGGGFADRVLEGATNASEPSGLTDTGDLEVVAGNIISSLLSVVGVLLVVLMIYAGFLWMTAGGNTDQVKKARSYIINAVIGLVIVFSAYAIVQFVLNELTTVATGVPS